MSRREFFEESTLRKGFASAAVHDNATVGQVLALNAAGEAEFSDGGGDPFNGGTITEELVVDATSPIVDAALHVQTDGSGGESPLLLDASVDGDPTGQCEFQSQGRILLTSFTAGGDEARIEMVDTTPGNAGQLQLSTYSGISMTLEASAQAYIAISPRATHTGFLLEVRDVNGDPSFQIHADGSIHIPTGTSIVADL